MYNENMFQALKQEEQSLGYTYKGKTEIDLDNDVDRTDSIEIKVDFEDVPRNMNPIWKHSVDKDGYPIHPVSKVMNKRQRNPKGQSRDASNSGQKTQNEDKQNKRHNLAN